MSTPPTPCVSASSFAKKAPPGKLASRKVRMHSWKRLSSLRMFTLKL